MIANEVKCRAFAKSVFRFAICAGAEVLSIDLLLGEEPGASIFFAASQRDEIEHLLRLAEELGLRLDSWGSGMTEACLEPR